MPRFLVDPTRGDQDGYGEESAGGLSMTDVAESDLSMRAALIALSKKLAKRESLRRERVGFAVRIFPTGLVSYRLLPPSNPLIGRRLLCGERFCLDCVGESLS